MADLYGADLEGADLQGADLLGTKLERVNLQRAQNLSLNQLSKVETLYKAKIDSELLIPLKEKYPALLKHDYHVIHYKVPLEKISAKET